MPHLHCPTCGLHLDSIRDKTLPCIACGGVMYAWKPPTIEARLGLPDGPNETWAASASGIRTRSVVHLHTKATRPPRLTAEE